jgi:cGMP-dependent protein kinase
VYCYVRKNAKTKHKENKDTGATFKQQTEQLSLDKLFSAKSLGHGQFGRVYLVTNETRSCEYALKCIEKCMILESRLEKHLQNEKLVLEQINHPFLIQYGRSFKDANYIYFLTEHINGMEMFDVIRDIGLLKSRDTCLYIAQMLQALDYLHRNNIIYRDLKPENIMVDKEGYLKLIDMGTCKIMSTKATLPKTFTIIGTPHYMGPEVLSGKGYTYHADLWSLGVCMYEFMVGYVPFGEDAEDPYEIYSEIIKKDIEFPNYINDDKAKALMRQLLSKIPETRLGGSFAALYNNPWFSSI